jgi:hypothetical protein
MRGREEMGLVLCLVGDEMNKWKLKYEVQVQISSSSCSRFLLVLVGPAHPSFVHNQLFIRDYSFN